MALKIRLARGGAKKRPFYRIVVAEASAPRDGRFVERLGSYNPMLPSEHNERVVLNQERAQYWMSKGAKPTLRVHKMMTALGLSAAPEIREQPKKSALGKKRLEREAEAAVTPIETPAAAAPADAPAEASPADPAEEAAAKETTAEAASGGAATTEAPAEETPAEETPAEAPKEATAEESAEESVPGDNKTE